MSLQAAFSKLEQIEREAKERASKNFQPDVSFDFQDKRIARCPVCRKATEQTIETSTDIIAKGNPCNPSFHKNTEFEQDYWQCSECEIDVQNIGRQRFKI